MKYIFLSCSLLFAAHLPCSAAAEPAKEAAAPAATGGFSGKVVETMNAGGYTYVLIDTGSKKQWAAAPQVAIKAGDSVAVGESMEMRNYQSKTLNRTFDVVSFTDKITVNGKSAPASSQAGGTTGELPPGHPPIGGTSAKAHLPEGHPVVGAKDAQAPPDFSKIKKAPGGKTVAEIYAGKAKLNGQQTSVRGKVVKYNAMIMGKNWIHIQDGTGAAGSNDLLVTSATQVKVGDTILVTGKAATDKDFSAGYKFSIMIEDAKIVVE